MPRFAPSSLVLFFLAITGCAAGSAASPPGTPEPPSVVGASAEGVVERQADGAHLLRGPKGEMLYLLQQSTDPLATPESALALHEGQRVSVTGIVTRRADGAPILSVGSLVVVGGGELDRVIAAITQLHCADVTFAGGDSYRLDALHGVGEDRFPVHVQSSGKGYTVWVLRRPDLPAGYALDKVLRAEGKDLIPICASR